MVCVSGARKGGLVGHGTGSHISRHCYKGLLETNEIYFSKSQVAGASLKREKFWYQRHKEKSFIVLLNQACGRGGFSITLFRFPLFLFVSFRFVSSCRFGHVERPSRIWGQPAWDLLGAYILMHETHPVVRVWVVSEVVWVDPTRSLKARVGGLAR
ncbi:hypothetical protein LZ32DRAFT_319817 [Colletotrichum eremochloae]|nr:hypothetical protein LZ32DRAFT_319817 [Colletotrichum eremochloae]